MKRLLIAASILLGLTFCNTNKSSKNELVKQETPASPNLSPQTFIQLIHTQPIPISRSEQSYTAFFRLDESAFKAIEKLLKNQQSQPKIFYYAVRDIDSDIYSVCLYNVN